MNTKAKINLTEGTIELEGSEDFVVRYLDEFKALLKADSTPSKGTSPAGSGDKPKSVKKTAVKKASSAKPKAKKVTAERFDIHGGGETPSLKGFFDEKKPGQANGNRIAVIGYYITEFLNNDTFSEGQVEYAYKMLKLKRPNHLHQIMVNNKNEKDFYSQADEEGATWTLTRTGELYVADQLPEANE